MAASALVIIRAELGTTPNMPTEMRDRAMRDTYLTLTAEPLLHVAPGEVVSLRCRMQGIAPETIVGALLRFVLPPEAVVAASDPAVTVLPALEPYAELTIARTFSVHAGSGNGVALRCEAVLLLPDSRMLRSNCVVLEVRARARLNGPQTFVVIEPTDDPHEIRVACTVANEGTLAAHMVAIDVPPPAGTRSVEPSDVTAWTIEHLPPGEFRSFAYRARITTPRLPGVCIADASLRDRTGTWSTLAPSATRALQASLSTPQVDVTRIARRLHVRIRGTNRGSGSACAVGFRLRWPTGFDCNSHSITWNAARVPSVQRPQAFAQARVCDDGADIMVAFIDAGEAYELALDLAASAAAQTATLTVDVSAGDTAVRAQTTLVWHAQTDIRMRIVAEPEQATPIGQTATILVELLNAGDSDAAVALHVNATQAQIAADGVELAPGDTLPIAAGDWRHVTIAVRVTEEVRDGQLLLPIVARVRDRDVAYAEASVHIRRRVCIDGTAWFALEEDAGIVRLHNSGSTTARNVVVVCTDGERIEVGDIAAGATSRTSVAHFDGARVAHGASLYIDGQPTLALEPFRTDAHARDAFDAVVSVAQEIDSAQIAVTLRIVCTTPTHRLTMRAHGHAALASDAGSLTVNGRALGNPGETAAIYDQGGLWLSDVNAGEHIDVRWKFHSASQHTPHEPVCIDIDADGRSKRIFSQELARTGTHQPAGPGVMVSTDLPALVYAGPPVAAAACEPLQAHGSVTLFLPLNRMRIENVIALLGDNRERSVLSHVSRLSGLIPTGVRCIDARVTDALAATHDALQTLLDRLSMKLRMPNYTPTSRDCDDPSVRRALQELFAAIAHSTARPLTGSDTAPALEVTLDRGWARRASEQVGQRALNDGAILSEILALVPVHINHFTAVRAALESYTRTLRAAVRDRTVDNEVATLEDARRRLVAALVELRVHLPLETDRPMYAG